MPPRRRTSNLIRKPRVAGLTPAAVRAGGGSAGGLSPTGPGPGAPPVAPPEAPAGRRDAAPPADPTIAEPTVDHTAPSATHEPTEDTTAHDGPAMAAAHDGPPGAAAAHDGPSGGPEHASVPDEDLFDDPSDAAVEPAPHSAENAAAETRHLAQVAVLPRSETGPRSAPSYDTVAWPPPAAGLPGRVAAVRARPIVALAVALAVSAVLAIGFAVADQLVRGTPAAANTALADVGATADVAGQLSSALETVYSYDFTQLDDNERLARDVITPAFAAKFDQLFAQVRQLAPQQQAVVSATVTSIAVQSIEGDRAVLVAFLDQQATRATPGAEPQQVNAAGRLTVTAELVNGTWKIAEVLNR